MIPITTINAIHKQHPSRLRVHCGVNRVERQAYDLFRSPPANRLRELRNLSKSEPTERVVQLVEPPHTFDGDDDPVVHSVVERAGGHGRREEAADHHFPDAELRVTSRFVFG
jgi:hypothetical protein